MKYFLFDVETTGLPKRRDISYKEVDNFPRIVQISWYIAELNNLNRVRLNEIQDYIISPNGKYDIPDISRNIHKISTAQAERDGILINDLANLLDIIFNEKIILVAHNLDFDINVLLSELYRIERLDLIKKIEKNGKICTMKSTTNLCKIPSNFKQDEYKWPRLGELYYKLFNKRMEKAHNAKYDVLNLTKCFNEIIQKKIKLIFTSPII